MSLVRWDRLACIGQHEAKPDSVLTLSNGENEMTIFIRTFAAIAAGAVITTSAFAQSASDLRGTASLSAIRNEPSTKLIAEDAQQQARDLLTGARSHQSTINRESQALAVGDNDAASIDPQEQARRLILGTPKVGHVEQRTMGLTLVEWPSTKRRAHSDPQELARRMILGAETANTPMRTRSASAELGVDSRR
jgi:hypothetical protein